jgi:hypothetical protein
VRIHKRQRGELSDDPLAFSVSDIYSWVLGSVVVTSLAAHIKSPI